jgi:hypothetical protein
MIIAMSVVEHHGRRRTLTVLLVLASALLVGVGTAGARTELAVSGIANDPFGSGLPLHASTRLAAPAGLTSSYGDAIALSGDGGTAVIGADTDNGGAGAAWVFVRAGGSWVQEGPKLTPRDGIRNGRFGESVAISRDGDMIAIGDGEGPAAAFVFVRSGGAWLQQGPRLAPLSAPGERRSRSADVAVAGDGGTVVSREPCRCVLAPTGEQRGSSDAPVRDGNSTERSLL